MCRMEIPKRLLTPFMKYSHARKFTSKSLVQRFVMIHEASGDE